LSTCHDDAEEDKAADGEEGDEENEEEEEGLSALLRSLSWGQPTKGK